jgi:hypothetical protein
VTTTNDAIQGQDFDFGYPNRFKFAGTVDKANKTAHLTLMMHVPIIGFRLAAEGSGSIEGEGLVIPMNPNCGTGQIKLYIRQGTEVFIQYNVQTVLGDGCFNDQPLMRL